jgi:hypothetical protein
VKNIQKVSLIVILLFALACPIPFSLAETIDNPTNNALNEKSPKTLAPSQSSEAEGILLAQREKPKARRSRKGFFSFFRGGRSRKTQTRKTQTRKNTTRRGIFSGLRFRRRSGKRPGFFQRLRLRRQQRRIEGSQRR